jgi:hypothetical protein
MHGVAGLPRRNGVARRSLRGDGLRDDDRGSVVSEYGAPVPVGGLPMERDIDYRRISGHRQGQRRDTSGSRPVGGGINSAWTRNRTCSLSSRTV